MAKWRSLKISGILCLLFSPAQAAAQGIAKVEVFGGYSYMPLDAQPDFHGFNVSVTRNWSRWLGVTADFSGHFSTEKFSTHLGPPPGAVLEIRSELRGHFLLFGPQLRIPSSSRLKPFGHALVGLSHRSLQVFTSTGSSQVPAGQDFDTGFSMALGGGLDIQVSRRIAIRAVRADYLLSRLGNLNHHDFRYAAGVVFHFGRR